MSASMSPALRKWELRAERARDLADRIDGDQMERIEAVQGALNETMALAWIRSTLDRLAKEEESLTLCPLRWTALRQAIREPRSEGVKASAIRVFIAGELLLMLKRAQEHQQDPDRLLNPGEEWIQELARTYSPEALGMLSSALGSTKLSDAMMATGWGKADGALTDQESWIALEWMRQLDEPRRERSVVEWLAEKTALVCAVCPSDRKFGARMLGRWKAAAGLLDPDEKRSAMILAAARAMGAQSMIPKSDWERALWMSRALSAWSGGKARDMGEQMERCEREIGSDEKTRAQLAMMAAAALAEKSPEGALDQEAWISAALGGDLLDRLESAAQKEQAEAWRARLEHQRLMEESRGGQQAPDREAKQGSPRRV